MMPSFDPWNWNLAGHDHALGAWLFLRLLGAVYLIAFASLGTQLGGLIGSRGIVPVAERLPALRGRARLAAFLRTPTLCWYFRSDFALCAMAWTGALAGLAVMLGVLPQLALFTAWLLYLSLFHAGGEFLAYQWDVLLLESGIVGMVLAPFELCSWNPVVPPVPGVVLGWLLLFRLVFGSGWAKLASGDRTWRDLTALEYHFETQPLPTPLAWYVHWLPRPILRGATAIVLGIELGVPFLLIGPSGARAFAALAIGLLMLAIQATGNFGFFQLLTLALCLLAVDDALIVTGMRAMALAIEPVTPTDGAVLPDSAAAVVTAPLFALAVLVLVRQLARHRPLPRPLQGVLSRLVPFLLVSPYGLFASMTTHRPEIVIEGSTDGVTWKSYEFRYKPGDPRRRPGYVAPHQPRLDWQLWFAALRGPRATRWIASLARRLLEGAPEVVRLFRTNPFPDLPPRFVRVRVFSYRYANPAHRRTEGVWWVRELLEEGLVYSLAPPERT
jgi:hypothetical protein